MTAPRRWRSLAAALAAGLAVVCALHAGAAGALEALAFVAPAMVVFATLSLGRYPGERLLLRRPRVRRRRPSRELPKLHSWVRVPRGGALLGTALAGRAPPPCQA